MGKKGGKKGKALQDLSDDETVNDPVASGGGGGDGGGVEGFMAERKPVS